MSEDRLFNKIRGPGSDTMHHLDAPFVATPMEVVNRLLDMAEVGPGDTLFDLGSGDGRMVVAAARRGARGVGIDRDPERIATAEVAARDAGVEALVEFRCEDLFATRLETATVVSLYLGPLPNMLLAPRLRSELAPGARIVSYCFPMRDWPPDAQDKIDYLQLNLWKIPEPV